MAKKRFTDDVESLKSLQAAKERLSQEESFPYSEDLRLVMDTQVYTCHLDSLLSNVLKDMAAKNISSAIVVDSMEHPVGILTERDIMQRIVTVDGFDTAQTPVSKVMTPNPVTLKPENTIYRALSVLSANGIKHLPLIEDDKVTGIITMRRLLKLRYPEPMTLIESIQDATDLQTLKQIKNKLPEMVRTRINSGRRAIDIVMMISLINRHIHRRTLELAQEKLGEPPAYFCLYVTGSHGRLENMLTPDQDHGMIIADTADQLVQYDEYYINLSATFSEWLNEIGFETCPGYVMCINPIWRKSLSEWKLQIEYWFEKQVRELGRFCTVLFDSAPLYGECWLFTDLKNYAFDLLHQHHEVLRVLHDEEGGHRVPTGFLGRFITETEGQHRGEFDIKRSGLIFMVESIRLLALLHDIRETSTIKRISNLSAGGFIHGDDAEYFEAAYIFLIHITLKTQVEKTIQGHSNTFINPKDLSARDRESLRHSFKAVSSLQDLVAGEFGELVL